MKLSLAVASYWLALPLLCGPNALAADLLPVAQPSFDQARVDDLLRGLTMMDVDGFKVGDILTAKKGERLYRRTIITRVSNTVYELAADLELEGPAALFGRSASTVAAGMYPAKYKILHPVYGELNYVPVRFKRGLAHALLIDQQGNLAPEMLRISMADNSKFTADKIEKTNDAQIVTHKDDHVFKNNSFDMIFAGVEGGLLSISVNCFDAGGTLVNKRTFRFPDDAKTITVAGDQLEVVTNAAGALSVRPLTPTTVGICKIL